jgi:hydroxyacylglutathione hydrolase
MPLQIKVFQTGMLGNNVCLLYEEASREAILFDPSYEPEPVMDFIRQQGLTVTTILLTHGHFDHFAGVAYFFANLPAKPPLGMHADDLDLMRDGGGSKEFHMPVFLPDAPDFFVEDGQILKLGEHPIRVCLTPGHTQGSVIYIIPDLECVVCGDLIFYHSVGRTDLFNSDSSALVKSIKEKVFTLPPSMQLIPGHGQLTTVQEELLNNPYINFLENEEGE